MMPIPWTPPDSSLELISVTSDQNILFFTMKSVCTSACCPTCSKISSRPHSRYTRKVQDLPICERPVQLLILTRKWFCENPNCSMKIFAERFEGISVNGQRTVRTDHLLRKIAFSTSCLSAEKVARAAHISVSHDTLLAIVHQTEFSPKVSPFCRFR